MATTLAPRNSSTRRDGARPAPPPPRPTRGRRNDGRIALGMLIVAVSVIATAAVFSRAGERVPVLVVRNEVPVGSPISESDLDIVTISADSGLAVIAAADAASVEGKVAAVGLVPGAPLLRSQLRDGSGLEGDEAIVGASLQPGQYPTELTPGDAVVLLSTPSGPDAPATAKDLGSGKVIAVDAPSDSSATATVSISVNRAQAPDVASASTSAHLSLVVVAP